MGRQASGQEGHGLSPAADTPPGEARFQKSSGSDAYLTLLLRSARRLRTLSAGRPGKAARAVLPGALARRRLRLLLLHALLQRLFLLLLLAAGGVVVFRRDVLHGGCRAWRRGGLFLGLHLGFVVHRHPPHASCVRRLRCRPQRPRAAAASSV